MRYGPVKKISSYVKKMATHAVSGGLSSLTYLGCVDPQGDVHYATDRCWSTDENGNPENILDITRGVMGANDTLMFIIERDVNRNVCHYTANLDDSGALVHENPVAPSWLIVPAGIDMHNMSIQEVEDDLTEEGLTTMETYAYGTKNLKNGRFMVNALKGEQLSMFQDQEGNYRTSIVIQGMHWVLRRIMIHTKPVMLGLYPSVSEIHLDVESRQGDPAQFFYAY